MVPAAERRHDDGMVNDWTWWLAAGTAVASVLTFLLAAAFRHRPRTVGLGVLLIPVTALCLWSFGLTADAGGALTAHIVGIAQVVGRSPGAPLSWHIPPPVPATAITPLVVVPAHLVPAAGGWLVTVPPGGRLTGGPLNLVESVSRPASAAETFWLGMCVLAIAALIAAVAARSARYLAAAGLVAFGIYQLIAIALFDPRANGTGSLDWLYGETSRGTVGAIAVASVAVGLVLARFTIVADLRARHGLASRVRLLTQSRAEAVDAAAAELRRLERDLHDGAQARLVAIGLSLRALEKTIPVDPGAATALAVECREASALALADLRDLVRGIYPPVLAERGLGDAVRALALDSPVSVAADVDLPGRPPAPVEAAVYFAVAEALSNVAKHANARRALVRVYHRDGMLRAEVTDDGGGGADPARGTGLAGIERRLAAFDGILAVSSPVGGPTIVVIEVPCALSWPKISTC
jgi:signal transduction histidine kinase